MTTWDIMDALAQDCEDYIGGIRSGRIKNGDSAALRGFQQRIAPQLGPISLLVLIKAWQENNPRPSALALEAEAAKKGRRGK